MLKASERERPIVTSDDERREKPARDPRLDCFRGLGMFIIYVAHLPDNALALLIPARFGFSDATEMFVFCSGMASAIAFGRLYDTAGFWLATGRVVQRIWQVYWSHIGVFLASVVAVVGADRLLGAHGRVVAQSTLDYFLTKPPAEALFGFLTLTFQPKYFDILPMYLVILVMLPFVMALSRVSLRLLAAAVGGVWLIGTLGYAQLPGDPWINDTWFFHPLGWQLLFYTGFAFMRGWLPAPPVERRLLWICIAILAASVPFAWWPLIDRSELLTQARGALDPFLSKNLFGPLRYIHFLALAYVAYVAAGPGGARLKGPAVGVFTRVGQQTLAVFMGGIVLAQLGAVILREYGYGPVTLTIVNGGGFIGLIAIAYVAHWFKSAPWRKPSHSSAKPMHQRSSRTTLNAIKERTQVKSEEC